MRLLKMLLVPFHGFSAAGISNRVGGAAPAQRVAVKKEGNGENAAS